MPSGVGCLGRQLVKCVRYRPNRRAILWLEIARVFFQNTPDGQDANGVTDSDSMRHSFLRRRHEATIGSLLTFQSDFGTCRVSPSRRDAMLIRRRAYVSPVSVSRIHALGQHYWHWHLLSITSAIHHKISNFLVVNCHA
jgi:hypothetical protein